MSGIAVLVVGDTSRAEFREARDSLLAGAQAREAADLLAASALVEQGEFLPEVIVVAQSYPGQFPAAQIDQLRRLAPLARVLGLSGAWCEGEMRTGKPWPGAIRVYWHQWPARWRHELARTARGLCPAWGLPVTATEEERLLAAAEERLARRVGTIGVRARSADSAEWLCATLESWGYEAVWLHPRRPPEIQAAAAVFDGTDITGHELEDLRRLAACFDRPRVVALVDFPRLETRRAALAAGAAAVLGKPVMLEDLYWQLERVDEGTDE